MSDQFDKEAVKQQDLTPEAAKIVQWQKTLDPSVMIDLVTRYQPIVNSVVNRYKTVGVSVPTLRAKANAQLFQALKTYDPSHNTQPSTHIWNNLQKVQRIAGESLQSGPIPEYRNLKKSTFVTIRDNLTDQFGRDPSVAEMADEMGWNQAEVERMNKELSGEVTASNAAFDFYGNSTVIPSRERELAHYLYHGLSGPEKIVYEHTFGYGGKPILKNVDIAKKLRTNEMAISRIKKKMAKRIKEYY